MGERIVFKDKSYRIMGACLEVYKEKGNGFLVDFGRHPKIEHEQFANPLRVLCAFRSSQESKAIKLVRRTAKHCR